MGARGGRREPAPATAKPRQTKAGGAPARQARAASGPSRGSRPAAAAPVPTPAPALSRGQRLKAHWLEFLTWGLSLAGLGVSIYLTIAHYTTSSILACSDSGLVNCGLVTTSPESMLFGTIPVADLGLAFYLLLAAVNSPWGWRAKLPALRWARLGSVIVGMVFVLYLIYTELYTLNAICLWCTIVHVITFLLFGLIVFATAAGYDAAARPEPGQPSG